MLVSPEFSKVMHGIHLTSPSSWSGHGARSLLNVGRREVRDARCPRWVSIRDAASYSPDIRCRRGFSIGDFSTIFAQKVQCATDPRPLALQISSCKADDFG